MHISALNHSVGEVKDRLSQEKGNNNDPEKLSQTDGWTDHERVSATRCPSTSSRHSECNNFFLTCVFWFFDNQETSVDGVAKIIRASWKALAPTSVPEFTKWARLVAKFAKISWCTSCKYQLILEKRFGN